MDTVLCPDCRIVHAEPAGAQLGHRVRCADCDLVAEADAAARMVYADSALAA